MIKNCILPKQTNALESNSNEYDNIKNKYSLFGRWIISDNSGCMNYIYEIYTKGNEYIGIIKDKKMRTEVLERKSDKYYIKNSKTGEYYLINSNKQMELFDKNGDLFSIGVKAKRMDI